MTMRTTFFPFSGGENLVDPVITMSPGELQRSMNYETATNGGYRRVDGFEVFDGHPSPADTDKSLYATTASWIVAVEARRAAISAVPGGGDIRGVWRFNDVVYAFRDNAAVGATACVMYKSTASGWSTVAMNETLTFNTGTNEILVGDTITGVTSSATAVITHVLITSGSWSGNDAAGLIYYNPSTLSGTFQSETIKVGSTNSAIITGAGTTTSFPPGGSYKFINYNFYGSSDLTKMYGVNGVGQGFSFDGSDVIFIDTGMITDTPEDVIAHKKHLFFAFAGGSYQHSSPGNPYDWSAITGASEIAIGEDHTGFVVMPGDTLVLFGRNNISILYGTNVSDWVLKTYSTDAGAITNSVQAIGVPYFLDDHGVKRIDPTNAYGDFTLDTISQKMQPYLEDQLGNLVFSLKVRTKNQYRLFFNNQDVITLTLDHGRVKGMTRSNLGKTFTKGVSAETSTGQEVLYVGDSGGYVYQLDKGPSFNGAIVPAFIRPVFYHFKSPERIKRFIKIVLEMSAEEVMDMYFIPEFSYGDSFYPSGETVDLEMSTTAGYWDESSYWEGFYWDAQALDAAYGYFRGIGKNFRMYIKSSGQYEVPHTIQGAIVHYSIKGYKK